MITPAEGFCISYVLAFLITQIIYYIRGYGMFLEITNGIMRILTIVIGMLAICLMVKTLRILGE